jgi:hypothetical protein
MRVVGEWLLCDDGVVRPTVPALVQAADGAWIEMSALLDAGADRTVFSARFLNQLRASQSVEISPGRFSGIGGDAGYLPIQTGIRFIRDDGQRVTVRGSFAVFTDIESADLSILGRDVTNNFGVIYDYPNRVVALLAPPHSYEIRAT